MHEPRTARAFADDRVRLERSKHIWDPPVEPINKLIHRIALDVGTPNLPYNDPLFGGVDAEVLIVLKAPEADADPDMPGMRFLCFDNADSGAANIFDAFTKHRIPRSKCIAWNICPFPIEGGTPSAVELGRARPYTQQLIEMLPRLKVVLLLGGPAAKGWDQVLLGGREGVTVFKGASPSPPGINTSKNRESFDRAVSQVAAALQPDRRSDVVREDHVASRRLWRQPMIRRSTD